MRCPQHSLRCDGPDGTRPRCAVCSEERIRQDKLKLDALALDLGSVVNERDGLKLQKDEAERKGRDLCQTLGENLMLLLDLRRDIKEHNNEFKHVTPPALLARLEEACGFAEKPVDEQSHSVDQTKPRLQRSSDLCQPKNLFNDPKPTEKQLKCEHKWERVYPELDQVIRRKCALCDQISTQPSFA